MAGTDQSKPPRGFRTLWIWVILAFLLLIAAWTTLIVIATRNQPEVIEVQH